MRRNGGSRIVAAALIVLAGVAASGCAQQQHGRVGAWGDQWYRKGKTPEDIAKWERAHPEHPGRPNEDDGPGAGEGPN